ncbi:hypothetical protein ACROYT_G019700 [Oculina patagonica]
MEPTKPDGDEEEAEDKENEPEIAAQLMYRSLCHYTSTLYLNLHQHHFSYIKDLKKYAKSYCCSRCGTYWKHVGKLHRHERTCEAKVRYTFPGGAYKTSPTIFQLLEDEGVTVPEHLKYFPYRATFDFECMFSSTTTGLNDTDKLAWDAKHIPLSVSICSNVPGYDQPKCFVTEGDAKQLVKKMVDYLVEISNESYRLVRETFSSVFEAIEKKLEDLQQTSEPSGQQYCGNSVQEQDSDDEGEDLMDTDDEEEDIESETEEDRAFIDNEVEEEEGLSFYRAFDRERENKDHQDHLFVEKTPEKNDPEPMKKKEHPLKKLKYRLEEYLKELPVLGFNSGKYDLNAVKEFLFPVLVQNEEVKFTIKRNNNFMCLKTEHLRFLDVTNFLAPGFSYDKFLKAYECTQTKGFFPYEWMDSLDKLNQTFLPPHEAFYSTLKKQTSLRKTTSTAYKCGRITKCKHLKIFLCGTTTWMFNLFVMRSRRCVDFGKTRTWICLDKNKDLYTLFKKNMVGGPSIIVHRYHEAGKTKIREVEMTAQGKEAKMCQKIVGYDANALYLWAIMQNMPTGSFTRRREETGFKRESSSKMATQWLEWEAQDRGIYIRHQMNDKEKRVGERRIPLDGFHAPSQTVFQFHGCWWHGHNCHLTHGKEMNEKRKKTMAELLKETRDISQYIVERGYKLVEIYECEWLRLKRTNSTVQKFLSTTFQRPLDHHKSLTKEQILRAICDESLFGVVECDIRVPDHLKGKFSEMCPIFKNTEISREDIGEYMQAFAEEQNIMPRPRRSLIGSYFGERILLATPLIKWYLEHGLEVTHVYQFVEYTPVPCFEPFGEAVSDARRAGDVDPNKAIIADTMKLVGNSSYGKTINDQERHREVKFCEETKASRLINTPFFRGIDQIEGNTYEVQSCKKTIKLNLPMQIGFFVYQYAKLRMLQFYFDFMDKYLDRSDFQYCETDTDSAYIALSGPSVESLVRLELREEFEKDKCKWFPRTDTPENKAYDKRTPGVFKEEWSGEGIIGLSSKTYYCFGSYDKVSCKGLYRSILSHLSMAQRLRKNHDFLKLLAKCTPAQRKAILKVADDSLVRSICECVFNVLKETVPVSKPAKRKLLTRKKQLIALAEKSTPLHKKKTNFSTTRWKPFRCSITARSSSVEHDSRLKMNHAKRMVLVPENTLDRLQQRQSILTPPVTQTLKNLDGEMNEILSSKELDDEQKAKLYNQVLQRYLTFYDQRKGQPLHVKLTTSKPAAEKPQPEESKESQQEEAQETISTAVEQEVMKSVPKVYKTGARQLLDKIKENRDVLH